MNFKNSAPSSNKLEIKNLQPQVQNQCMQIYFRQSFINDWLTCPQMALYRWILNLEQEGTFMAAVLGSAGHKVIYTMHKEHEFDYEYLDLLTLFNEACEEEIEKLDRLPPLPKDFESIQEFIEFKAPEYVEMLQSYQEDDRNRTFYATMFEQYFTLEIPSHIEGTPPYIFTGQIDQGGPYADGVYALRDIKFRDESFKPSQVQRDLDIQFTIYACALRWGNPACNECKPRYEEDVFGVNKKLVYDGPCETCREKIGTAYWPQKFAERCELVWMRDYIKYKSDQYAKEIIDKKKRKVVNPETKRKVYQRVINPKWVEGYKTGDCKGPAILKTYRRPASLEVFMSDVIRVCDTIRSGVFWRKPGDHCNFWCKHKEQCLSGVEHEVEEIDLSKVSTYGTEDPF